MAITYKDALATTQTTRDHDGELENELVQQPRRRHSDFYRELFERSADAILIIDGERFVACNQATVDMLRYNSRAELLQAHPSQISPERQPDGRLSYEKANEMMAIAREKGSHRFEWDHRRADGDVFPVEVLLTALPTDTGMIIHTAWRDITERRRLQNELHQSHKLEAIGKLAGGIAHDFNNLLVAILGNSELLSMDLDADSPLQEYVQEIQLAGERAADLVGQLLAYSRKQVLHTTVLDLNAELQKLSPMHRHLIGESIRTTERYSARPLPVRADAGKIGQVLMNLVTNARDAMPDGGTISIETLEIVLGESAPKGGRTLPPGRYAVIRVADTGCGIDSAVIDKIFDPFFTTRHKGTGLGLSTVIGIVHQSGGEITVANNSCSGTVFTVYLPITDESVTPDEQPEQKAVGFARTGETILVVEDEASVARIVKRILVDEGYKVHTAEDGLMALKMIQVGKLKFDLLLTDVIMPNMGGPELARRLTASRPDLRVLYASGYTNEFLTGQAGMDQDVELIQKPYSAEQLKRKVRRILDAG